MDSINVTKSTDHMLTTIDNPYDPFEDFTNWWLYDTWNGYNTCDRLAKLTNNSFELSDKEDDDDIEKAIDEIVLNDPLNIYIKVSPKTK